MGLNGPLYKPSPCHLLFRWLGGPPVAVIVNMTPVAREAIRLGLPRTGTWREVLNTDAASYGGSGAGNMGRVIAETVPMNGFPASASLFLPALATIWLVAEGPEPRDDADEKTQGETDAE
jgi:1,4-alpha-glucan branching enzyme